MVQEQPLSNLSHDIPVIGPIGVGATVDTTWTQVIGADHNRRGIIFHNPTSAVNLRVAPANLAVQNQAGAFLIYPGDMLELFAEDDLTNVGQAWMAWSDTSSSQPLTILNFTGANAAYPPPMPLSRMSYRQPILSPSASGLMVGIGAILAIGPNPVRRGIRFHNGGVIGKAVCPSNLTPVFGGAGSITVSPGQTIYFRAHGRIRVNCGWNCVAQSGSGDPFTISEDL